MSAIIQKLKLRDVQKGTRIEPRELEQMLEADAGSDAYRFKLMAAAEALEAALDADGRPAHVRAIKNGLQVLTDDEETRYQHQFMESTKRSVEKNRKRTLQIDTRNLDSAGRRARENLIRAQAFVLQGFRDADELLLTDFRVRDNHRLNGLDD